MCTYGTSCSGVWGGQFFAAGKLNSFGIHLDEVKNSIGQVTLFIPI